MTGTLSQPMLLDAAARLVGVRFDGIDSARGGGNNRAYRVHGSMGSYCLKHYHQASDFHDRIHREFAGLEFVGRRDPALPVPRAIAADLNSGIALFEWIEGEPARYEGTNDIDQMIGLARGLRRVADAAGSELLPNAAESCLSAAELITQIERRRTRLAEISLDHPELGRFLRGPFESTLARATTRLEALYRAADIAVDGEIAKPKRTLSPSDFGLHNAIRRTDRNLVFIDFEYFGWDDPVKLASDVLWHPGMAVSEDGLNRFRDGIFAIHADDDAFAARFNAQYPLFGLRWVMIVLNEYHPDRWRRRIFAGETRSRAEVLARQLAAAETLVDRVRMMMDNGGAAPTGPALSPPATSGVGLDARSKYLRELVIESLEGGGRGHVGSTLSLIELLRVLYDDVLNVRPNEPRWPDRDRLILSKGHGCLALYAVLADKGFFPTGELRLQCRPEAMLGGHPERAHIPGVEASTGALGHGLSIGVGMAIAAQRRAKPHRVFVVMGDGELDEGSVWEAAMCAAKHRLSNLVAVIDRNNLQSFGRVADVLDLEPLADKFRAFGFAVAEIDGHDLSALRQTFRACPLVPNRPSVVICRTVKGRGFDFAEHNPAWHHKAKVEAADVAKMRAALERQ